METRGRPRRSTVIAAIGALAFSWGAVPVEAADRVRPGLSPAGACALRGYTGDVSEALPTPRGYARAQGTVRALTVFVDFPDAPATVSTRERYAEFFPATTEYLAASSYGRLDYRPHPVHRWLRMSRPLAEYGIGRASRWHTGSNHGYDRLMREIRTAVAAEVDFADFDLTNVLMEPEAGPPATDTVLSVTFAGYQLLPKVRNVSFVWSRQPGESAFRVLPHENGHSFGLPDLYWTGDGPAPLLAGHWDVMESDWGPTNDFMAWHKWKLGWLAAGQMRCVTRAGVSEHHISPGGRPEGVKLVAVPVAPDRVLTLEVRVRSRLDRMVCRPGVLVAHVSTRVRSGSGPVRVADARPASGGCLRAGDPDLHPELSDAPHTPGETFTDPGTGVRVDVLEAAPDGTHRVRVSRP
ncbi:M6 family metalloprotease domain-containing protein [Streptomyces sp. 549]|uniref:M6 family metalloprotease domain-containing protein n=1 Tax=Streptomyces sp. 549 TaxID=3049076 RepID=UPI0024C43699|nr:M6 family metalloprotease domain-containing protein [Streptomyces sp. 549]MDK1477045.1 M6 family metalloprotease domain-containing protein [Streptomyces sp. 549]